MVPDLSISNCSNASRHLFISSYIYDTCPNLQINHPSPDPSRHSLQTIHRLRANRQGIMASHTSDRLLPASIIDTQCLCLFTHLEKNDEERFEIEIVQGFFGRRTNLQEEKVPIWTFSRPCSRGTGSDRFDWDRFHRGYRACPATGTSLQRGLMTCPWDRDRSLLTFPCHSGTGLVRAACLSHWDKHNLSQSTCPTGTGCACPIGTGPSLVQLPPFQSRHLTQFRVVPFQKKPRRCARLVSRKGLWWLPRRGIWQCVRLTHSV